jgi:hypothetical protein
MPQKPDKQTIISTYSMNEIVELAKEKAKIDAEQTLSNARDHLSALMDAFGVEQKSTMKRESKTIVQKEKRGRGRPKLKKTEPLVSKKGLEKHLAGEKSSKASRGKKVPLNELVLKCLGKKPMSVKDLINALKQKGWQSRSNDPRRVLYLELGKMVKNGSIIKSGRGMYEKG